MATARPNRYKRGKLRGAKLTAWRKKHPTLAAAAAAARSAARSGKPTRRKRAKRAKRNAATVAAPNRRRRTRARRNFWRGDSAGHAKAARKGWRKRRGSTKRAAPKRRRRAAVAVAAPKRRRRRHAKRNVMYSANRRRRARRYEDNPRRRRRTRRYEANRRRARRYEDNPRRRRRTRRYAENRKPRYEANKRRRTRRTRRYESNMMYAENKRRRFGRRARRNPDIMGQLKSVLGIGLKVTGGFVAHRGLTYLVSEQLLAKATVFQTGAAANWRGVIGGAIVALIGVPAVHAVSPKHSKEIGAGIVASLLHNLFITILKVAGQPKVAGYLAAYPDAPGVAYHSMGAYEAVPGYNGYGAYEAVPGYSGFGAIQQAAGAYPQIMQGAGAIYQAQGEYEAVQGFGEPAGYMDEGIRPDLYSAERALTIAEAAGSLGDMPMVDTSNPQTMAAPIEDEPGGSRAGVFEGGDGIFG